jgi:hypothetical protein
MLTGLLGLDCGKKRYGHILVLADRQTYQPER